MDRGLLGFNLAVACFHDAVGLSRGGRLLLQVDDHAGHQQPQPADQPKRRRQHPGHGPVHLGILGILRTVADRDLDPRLRLSPEAIPAVNSTVRPSGVLNRTTGW